MTGAERGSGTVASPSTTWVFGGPWTYGGERGAPTEVDNAYLAEVFDSGGALICGRTMYDVVNGSGEEPGFGVPAFGGGPHRPHERVVKGDTSLEFIAGGIGEALSRARAAAATKNVIVMGGGDLLCQYLAAGMIDEFTLTIAPVLLGAGKHLFDGSDKPRSPSNDIAVIESPSRPTCASRSDSPLPNLCEAPVATDNGTRAGGASPTGQARGLSNEVVDLDVLAGRVLSPMSVDLPTRSGSIEVVAVTPLDDREVRRPELVVAAVMNPSSS